MAFEESELSFGSLMVDDDSDFDEEDDRPLLQPPSKYPCIQCRISLTNEAEFLRHHTTHCTLPSIILTRVPLKKHYNKFKLSEYIPIRVSQPKITNFKHKLKEPPLQNKPSWCYQAKKVKRTENLKILTPVRIKRIPVGSENPNNMSEDTEKMKISDETPQKTSRKPKDMLRRKSVQVNKIETSLLDHNSSSTIKQPVRLSNVMGNLMKHTVPKILQEPTKTKNHSWKTPEKPSYGASKAVYVPMTNITLMDVINDVIDKSVPISLPRAKPLINVTKQLIPQEEEIIVLDDDNDILSNGFEKLTGEKSLPVVSSKISEKVLCEKSNKVHSVKSLEKPEKDPYENSEKGLPKEDLIITLDDDDEFLSDSCEKSVLENGKPVQFLKTPENDRHEKHRLPYKPLDTSENTSHFRRNSKDDMDLPENPLDMSEISSSPPSQDLPVQSPLRKSVIKELPEFVTSKKVSEDLDKVCLQCKCKFPSLELLMRHQAELQHTNQGANPGPVTAMVVLPRVRLKSAGTEEDFKSASKPSIPQTLRELLLYQPILESTPIDLTQCKKPSIRFVPIRNLLNSPQKQPFQTPLVETSLNLRQTVSPDQLLNQSPIQISPEHHSHVQQQLSPPVQQQASHQREQSPDPLHSMVQNNIYHQPQVQAPNSPQLPAEQQITPQILQQQGFQHQNVTQSKDQNNGANKPQAKTRKVRKPRTVKPATAPKRKTLKHASPPAQQPVAYPDVQSAPQVQSQNHVGLQPQVYQAPLQPQMQVVTQQVQYVPLPQPSLMMPIVGSVHFKCPNERCMMLFYSAFSRDLHKQFCIHNHNIEPMYFHCEKCRVQCSTLEQLGEHKLLCLTKRI